MTSSRAQWLRKLLAGPAKRRSTVVAFQCMQLGWTDWRKEPDGRFIPGAREVITEAGRAALQAHEEMEKHGTRPIANA